MVSERRIGEDERFSLKGKTALVMGSTRNQSIGKAIAESFLLRGATVMIHGQDKIKKAKEWVNGLQQSNRNISNEQFAFYAADMSIPKNVTLMLADIRENHGPLDYLVLNVAVGARDNEEYARQVNNTAQVYTVKEALRLHALKNRAKIIYIASHVSLDHDSNRPLSSGNSAMQDELATYNLVAKTKNEGIRNLTGLRMRMHLAQHNVSLALVTAPLVRDTLAHRYLKKKGLDQVAEEQFGWSTFDDVVNGVMTIVEDPHTRTGDLVIIKPEYLRRHSLPSIIPVIQGLFGLQRVIRL